MIRLGLIGDNIRESRSPRLHRLAARLCGLELDYEPLIPAEVGLSFDALYARCREEGFRGLNITYPYKEFVFGRLDVADPNVRAVGACNTVLFQGDVEQGWNTDYTGFRSAYRAVFADTDPGIVTIAGAGGVGRAMAFALVDLGALELRIVDTDREKAEALAIALRSLVIAPRVVVAGDVAEAASGSEGLVNSTPLGMSGIPGTAIPRSAMAGCHWAFDAVYTPIDTRFLTEARSSGLETISGYELFFHQGVDAFRHFTGHDVDVLALREALAGSVSEAA